MQSQRKRRANLQTQWYQGMTPFSSWKIVTDLLSGAGMCEFFMHQDVPESFAIGGLRLPMDGGSIHGENRNPFSGAWDMTTCILCDATHAHTQVG